MTLYGKACLIGVRQALALFEARYGVIMTIHCERPNFRDSLFYEHPVVLPQVSHFRHVPFRTSVKLAHSGQASPT